MTVLLFLWLLHPYNIRRGRGVPGTKPRAERLFSGEVGNDGDGYTDTREEIRYGSRGCNRFGNKGPRGQFRPVEHRGAPAAQGAYRERQKSQKKVRRPASAKGN